MGQPLARRAMVLAAAGGHNVLLIGAPGTGKSMLAKRLPGILPPLTREEAVETTKIYSIAGQLPKGRGLISARPFRSPHHSASAAALAGGGTTFRPAESSADLRKQVLAARAVQAKRYAAPGYEGVRCNAQLTAGQVRRVCRMTPAAERLLRASYDTLGLSARAHDRIRVARTVADLAGKQLLDEEALLEALQYRAQEKVETF